MTRVGVVLPRDTFEELRKKMIQSARQGITEAYSSEEYALIQAINAYLDISKTYNLMYERLTEWYGIYFPEVQVGNPRTLASLAILAAGRTVPDHAKLAELIGDEPKAAQVHDKIQNSIGRKMNDDESNAVMKFAQLSRSMDESLTSLEQYLKIASNRLLPNTTFLTDEKIAAELLSKAGSMERLATMPASTVQLLGAEKALFKHIKFGSKPPKYGVIFKMPEVNTAQKDQRGRIARVYATKICIALKADYYTKKPIGPQLKKSLDEAIQKIKSSPPRERKPAPAQGRQGPRRFQRGNRGGGGRPQGGRRPSRPF